MVTNDSMEVPTPGTIQLIDADGTVRSRHTKDSGGQDIILIPQPSSDPEDPLNWTYCRKLLHTSCVVM